MVLAHIIIVVLTGVLVLFSDEQALEWMRGEKEKLNAKVLDVLHGLVSLGLLLLILTGGLMFLDRSSFLLSSPSFSIKMFFVLALVVNAFFIGTLSKIATERTFAELSFSERIPLFVSGGVSITAWIGAVIAALYIS